MHFFRRRSENTIIFPINLFHVSSNIWNFIYLSYEEEQLENKLECRLSFSLNAAEITKKEFEIHFPPPTNSAQNSAHTFSARAQNFQTATLNFFIGHQEKKPECMNYSFHYDIGQVILSKDTNFTIEHLLMIMQVMDTNISQIDKISEYDWAFLNGFCDAAVIENLQKNFNEYTGEIKSHAIAAFNPRNPHVAALKLVGQKNWSYVDLELASSFKPIQQYTLDVALAKVGGIRQLLILIAKVFFIKK